MTEDQLPPEQLAAEVARLRRELSLAQRQVAQIRRVAETSEALATQSKHAMLRTNSELRNLVDELRQAKTAAERATVAKGRFLAMMSHELRTPLHGMIGSAELLMGVPLAPEHAEIVQLLHRSGTSLLAIVNDVLDYSRVDAGLMPLEHIPFPLRDCVREVVDLQVSGMRARGIDLSFRIDPQLPEFVTGDPGRLRQVMMNLVSNALKFTVEGSVAIAVEPAEVADLVQFSVTDTGVGIAPEIIGRLFEAFVQEDASTTRRFGGTGLGLAICKRLVQLMGGRIGVESQPGRGSKFWFTCRLERASEADPIAAPTIVPAVAGGDRCRRVLVVDDHDGNRLLVRRMLERLGIGSEESVDGAQAVQRIAVERFDLVLMDCSMPVMDGYDATRTVRKLGTAHGKVPIIALTANALPEDRQKCIEAGMDGYLAKPLRMAELSAELERLLGDVVVGPGTRPR